MYSSASARSFRYCGFNCKAASLYMRVFNRLQFAYQYLICCVQEVISMLGSPEDFRVIGLQNCLGEFPRCERNILNTITEVLCLGIGPQRFWQSVVSVDTLPWPPAAFNRSPVCDSIAAARLLAYGERDGDGNWTGIPPPNWAELTRELLIDREHPINVDHILRYQRDSTFRLRPGQFSRHLSRS